MKYLISAASILLVIGCSSQCHLQMDTDADLSVLPSDAQCWLVDFENVCISLSENEGFNDTEQLENDVKRAALLLKELSDEKQMDGWYGRLTEAQSDRLHELMLAIAIHYGVKHFLDV